MTGYLTAMGRPLTPFALPATRGAAESRRPVASEHYKGGWLLLFFYPRDFTFVCPTELVALSARASEFEARGCALLGVSVDDLETHERWLSMPQAEGGVSGLRFDLASDEGGGLARALGVYDEAAQVAGRALFLVDPEGCVQYQVVHNLNVGRNPDEILRVLDALQTGGLCRAGWRQADGTIDPQRNLHAGTLLGRYRIERPLDSGAFGHVYLAFDTALERRVAVKFLRHSDPVEQDALLEEARAAATVVHPNLGTIHSIDRVEGLHVMVMEYIAGPTLRARLGDGPMAGREVLRLTKELSAALAACHAAGVVHGDLKPGNIILSSGGAARLVDFGISRRHVPLFEAQGPGTRTGGSSLHGTPGYLAPEQFLTFRSTPASDVFSLALVLIEAFRGERVIRSREPVENLTELRCLDVKAVTEGLRTDLAEVLSLCLAAEPERRPSMRELSLRVAGFNR